MLKYEYLNFILYIVPLIRLPTHPLLKTCCQFQCFHFMFIIRTEHRFINMHQCKTRNQVIKISHLFMITYSIITVIIKSQVSSHIFICFRKDGSMTCHSILLITSVFSGFSNRKK